MTPDNELLRQYADQGDEAAFAEVVRRHLNLVYGLAVRLLNGNAAIAEDVTQSVFTDLARKAGQLRKHETVVGWLHTSTRFAAAKAIRADVTRAKLEQEASAMHDQITSTNDSFATLRPLLDEAVGDLGDRERDAVLLRFFEDKSYREVGDLLGWTENTARMRVERALDKLRAQFSRRGVTTTAALLSSALGAHGAVISVPASLATSVVNQSLAGVAGPTAAPGLLPKFTWPVWAGTGAVVAVLLFLIFQKAPANGTTAVSPNRSTPSSTMTPSQIIRSGTLSAALLATTPTATAQNTPPVSPPPAAASPAAPADAATVAALVTANNRFAIDLFRQFNPKPNENVFFSPYSISTALAMTWAGAKGDTAAQIAKVFHFSDVPTNTVPASFAALQQSITKAQTLSGTQLSIANTLWPEQNPEHPFRADYLGLVQANFSTTITPVDFVGHAADAAKQINDWVESKTNGKIKEVLHSGDVDKSSRLVLVNAIYFKGAWMHPFYPNANLNAEFHAANGGAIPAVLMHEGFQAQYLDIITGPAPCQILSLPYSNDSTGRTAQGVSFVALLPHDGTELSTLTNSLTVEQLDGWLGKMTYSRVNVYLPKFKVEERFDLTSALQAMGVRDAFNLNAADFSGMNNDGDLFITKAIHQTFIDLDEKGTEAATATAMVLTYTGSTVPAETPPEFRADHPFLYLVRDDATGSILFLGQLANPAPLTEQIPSVKAGVGNMTLH